MDGKDATFYRLVTDGHEDPDFPTLRKGQFVGVKIWSQQINMEFKSGQEYWEQFGKYIYAELLEKLAENEPTDVAKITSDMSKQVKN